MTEEQQQQQETKNEDDENMTPAERMAWLRERGIEIVTPQEQRAARVRTIMEEPDSNDVIDAASVSVFAQDGSNDDSSIRYVMIPADISQPLQQMELKIPVAVPTAVPVSNTTKASKATTTTPTIEAFRHGGGDVLAEHLKTGFSTDADQVDLSLLPQGTTLVSGREGQETKVSPAALKQVAQGGTVETFRLIHPTSANQHTATNLYCDEIGMLKRLPINKRASQLADLVGYNPPPVFYGNVYVCQQDDDRKYNHKKNKYRSVTVEDLQPPYAKWLQTGATDNLNHQMEMNRITGKTQQQTQAAPIGETKPEEEEEGLYTWTQTEEEMELVLPIDSTTTNKKNIQVKFGSKRITVSIQKKCVLSLDLFERIDADGGGCTWTIEQSKQLVITLEKADAAFWPRIKA